MSKQALLYIFDMSKEINVNRKAAFPKKRSIEHDFFSFSLVGSKSILVLFLSCFPFFLLYIGIIFEKEEKRKLSLVLFSPSVSTK